MSRSTALTIFALTVFGSSAAAAASLELYGTFEAMGVIVRLDAADDPDEDSSASVEYRISGSGAYRPGMAPDRVRACDFVSSLFWLVPGTDYDVRVTMSDPDGDPVDGVVLTETASTRAEIVIPPPTASHYASPGATGAECTLASPCSLSTALQQVAAGEEVVLLAGVYHVGGLTAPSGAAGAPVVIRGETGQTAVLDGADPSAFTWTDQGGGIWHTTINAGSPQVAADDVRLYPYAGMTALMNLSWGVPGFYASGSDLYVRIPGDGDPNGAVMEISRHSVGFEIGSGKEYVYFLDLTFRNYGRNAYAKAIYFNGASDGLVRGCTFRHNETAVSFKRATHRVVVEENDISDSSWLWPWNAHKASGLLESFSTMFFDPVTGRGIVIRRNTIHGGFDGIRAAPSNGAGSPTNETDIYENLVYELGDDGLETDGTASNVRIWANTFHDALGGISMAPNHIGPTYVVGNVIYRLDTGDNQWPATAIKLNSGTSGSGVMYVLHNTIDVVTADQDALRIVSPGDWTKLVLRNNILSATDHVFRNGNTGQPTDFDHDCTFTTGSSFASWDGPGDLTTLEEFQAATGLETNAVFGAPDFTAAGAGDYTLQAGSPCVDMGVVLPGINDDYTGIAPDAGAFEVTCIATAPIGTVGNTLRAVASAGDEVDLEWPGATVSPPNFATFKTDRKAEVTLTPVGIGDELSLGVTTTTSSRIIESLTGPREVRFYVVLAADSCDRTVYP